MSVEQKVEQLQKQVAELQASVSGLGKLIDRTIEWEEQTSPSGIELAGMTRAVHRGKVVSMTPVIAGPGQILIMVMVIKTNGDIGVVTGPFKLVES